MKITRYPEDFGGYRYSLKVEFSCQHTRHNQGNLVVVMLNPATIQEERDLKAEGHHTRQRLIKLARDEEFGAMIEVNLFAHRSPKREDLLTVLREQNLRAVGPENDRVILEAAQEAGRIVVAWGVVAKDPLLTKRADRVSELLRSSKKQLHCLGKNKDGSPRNPARGKYVVQEWP